MSYQVQREFYPARPEPVSVPLYTVYTMSSNVVVCTIDQELKDELKKFRYSKAKEGSAIIMKVRIGGGSHSFVRATG